MQVGSVQEIDLSATPRCGRPRKTEDYRYFSGDAHLEVPDAERQAMVCGNVTTFLNLPVGSGGATR